MLSNHIDIIYSLKTSIIFLLVILGIQVIINQTITSSIAPSVLVSTFQERALKHQHQTLSAIRNCSLLKFKTKNEQRTRTRRFLKDLGYIDKYLPCLTKNNGDTCGYMIQWIYDGSRLYHRFCKKLLPKMDRRKRNHHRRTFNDSITSFCNDAHALTGRMSLVKKTQHSPTGIGLGRGWVTKEVLNSYLMLGDVWMMHFQFSFVMCNFYMSNFIILFRFMIWLERSQEANWAMRFGDVPAPLLPSGTSSRFGVVTWHHHPPTGSVS